MYYHLEGARLQRSKFKGSSAEKNGCNLKGLQIGPKKYLSVS